MKKYYRIYRVSHFTTPEKIAVLKENLKFWEMFENWFNGQSDTNMFQTVSALKQRLKLKLNKINCKKLSGSARNYLMICWKMLCMVKNLLALPKIIWHF